MIESEHTIFEASKSWKTLIHASEDLVTPTELTLQGFIDQAEEKSRRAEPIEERVHNFRIALEKVRNVEDLFTLELFTREVIAAASFSGKAWNHVEDGESFDDRITRLNEAFSRLYQRCQDATENEEACLALFRERILFRSLLTQGETLGGSMKNWIGQMGAVKLVEALRKVLGGRETVHLAKKSSKVQRIRWGNRLLLFDTTPTLTVQGGKVEVELSSSNTKQADETPVKIPLKNIDMILLDTSDLQQILTQKHSARAKRSKDILKLSTNALLQAERGLLKEPKYYLACGELKSGIDPAGGDEHWKTTMGALFDRIRNLSVTYSDFHPELFFVGRAIEAGMAVEIFERLENGVFSFAANLTNEDQVIALAEWLTTL